MGYVLHLTCPAEMWKPSPIPPTSTTIPFKSSAASAAERLSALSSSLTPSTSPLPLQLQPSAFLTPDPTAESRQPAPSIQALLDSTVTPSPLTPTPSPLLLSSSKSTSNQWKTFSAHLSALSTSQRADFVGRVSRAERYYATLSKVALEQQGPSMRVIGEEQVQKLRESGQIGTGFSSQSVKEMEESIEQLLEDLGCLQTLRSSEQRASEEFDKVEQTQVQLLGGQTSSRIVYISGYPFLLQIPPQFVVSAKERKEAFVQARKYQTIHTLLSTMLSIARSLQSSQSTSYAGMANPYQLPHIGRTRDAQQQFGPIPPVAGLAMQQGINRPNGLGAVGIGAQAAARLAGPGMPTARLAVVINLDEIMALAMPLLFLSVKLAFLIYVFGKHATARKRIVMCIMALAWVIWEGTSIHRRRRATEARRQQQQRAAEQRPQILPNERIQIRNFDQQDLPPNGPVALQPPLDLNGLPAGQAQPNGPGQGAQAGNDQFMPPALAQLRQRLQALGDQQDLRRRQRNGDGAGDEARRNARAHGSSSRSSSQRQPPSRLSPKYWLYLMAKVGLSAEAREMGLSRTVLRQWQAASRQATQNGTPVPPLPSQANQPGTPSAIRAYQSQPLTLQRALRNLYIGLVLFVGTLIPEVERLRKKALLKREKKLAELELTRRQMHLASLQAELKRLEDQRKLLEGEMANKNQAASGSVTQETGQTSDQKSTGQTAVESENASASTVRGGQAGETARQPAGLGIGAMQPSDGDSELFDPPFAKRDMQAALAASRAASRDSQTSSGAGASPPSGAADGNANAPPRIRIDTDANRPNDLLSPLRALQRRDENGNLLAEDDYSAPSTPLLSPAMTEDDDDRQDEGGDDDVGM